jgi:simple sugar transport system ATP-binding protein
VPPEQPGTDPASGAGAPAPRGGGAGPALLEAVGVEKRFGSTRALRGVDLGIHAGRCTGLVGRNGAGKSTLISILSGLSTPDAGEVRFDGRAAPPLRDLAAWRGRIATVHQHSMIVPELSVAENMFLGRPGGPGRIVGWRRLREQAGAILGEWGIAIAPEARCGDLTVEQRQIVEIARALATGARCVLLDEPTAALERGAVVRLFELVRQLTEGGVAVLYISHHLEEVFEVCRDVTVLRDGRAVLASAVADLSKAEMVRAMIGPAAVAAAAVPAAAPGTAPAPRRAAGDGSGLVLENLSTASARGPLRGVTLTVAPGERVGVTGLLSAGVATLGRVAAGVERPDGGRVLLDGREVPAGRRDLAQQAGIGYVPEDRRAEGFVAGLSIAENAAMTVAGRLTGRLGLGTARRRDEAVRPYVQALALVSSGLSQPVGELSGGNQQKVTVARTLIHDPRVIVAITPTRGVDVAAKELLLESLSRTARETGTGLLLASDELDDLVGHCDRIVVLVRGRVFAEFGAAPFDREELLAASEGIAISGNVA